MRPVTEGSTLRCDVFPHPLVRETRDDPDSHRSCSGLECAALSGGGGSAGPARRRDPGRARSSGRTDRKVARRAGRRRPRRRHHARLRRLPDQARSGAIDPSRSADLPAQVHRRPGARPAGERRTSTGEHPRPARARSRTSPTAARAATAALAAPAGFGGDVATRPDSRDAPHLFGLGLKEMLADEMTAELRATRKTVQAPSAHGHEGAAPSRCACEAKGVAFRQAHGVSRRQRRHLRTCDGVDDGPARAARSSWRASTVSIREFAIGGLQGGDGPRGARPACSAPSRIRCRAAGPRRAQRASAYDPADDASNARPSAMRPEDATTTRRSGERDRSRPDRSHGVLPAQLLQARASTGRRAAPASGRRS